MNKEISLEILRKIADKYIEEKSLEQSSKDLGYNIYYARKALKIFGINSRPKRKYDVDETYFEVIDTPEKAYWIGFIMADGNVYKTTLSIRLKASDQNHLEKFKISIKSNHKIRKCQYIDKEGRVHEGCEIAIFSKKIVEDIEKLGVVENKSLILNPCSYIPESFLKDYWRGLIDGDGTITFAKRKTFIDWQIGMVGTKEICEELLDFICKNLKIKKVKLQQTKKAKEENKNTYNFRIGGNIQVKKICSFFYKSSTIYLDRKYKRAKKIFEKNDLLFGQGRRVLMSKGFSFSKGKFQSNLNVDGKIIYLGRFKKEKEAFVAHKSAWYKKCYEKCENIDTIKEYVKKSVQNPNEWIKNLKIEKELKNYISTAYSILK